MPVIPNARKEHFARLIAKGGLTQLEAYTQAGYSEKSGQSAASVLANDPIILNRVQELREKALDRSLPHESKMELETLVDPAKIDEDWILKQYQDVISKSKDVGALKVARDCLLDIAAIKGIGKANQQTGSTDDKLPAPPQINIQVALERLSQNRDSLESILANAIDVTSESPAIPRELDSDDRAYESIEGDAESDGTD